MSAGPDPSTDLVAVACVVEASLLLASEWSRIFIDYVYPLLRRLNELHPSHQFRLAFVTYGAADTRPLPLLSKRFFAPLSVVTRELREEPSKLGIGQTNSGSGRGMSALEGLVAAIELFDILMASINSAASHAQSQSPQKESRSLIAHLLHIAASPPDSVQRPQWNTLQHLDSVGWDSIPAELRKRKINLSLISLRKIPQLQDLHSSVAGSGIQSPWFNVHAPHILLLAGFPTPQKTGTKRQTDPPPSEQSPDTKRQKVVVDPISKTSSASPALPSARIPLNQRSQQPVSLQSAQPPPTTVSGQNPPSVQPVQATISAPPSASTSPSGPPLISASSLPPVNPDILDQVVTPTGVKFGQMMERLKALEREMLTIESQITNAQDTGQSAVVAGLQKDRIAKIHIKEQIKSVLRQHYQKFILPKDAPSVQTGTGGPTLPDGLAEAGPSAQPHQSNAPDGSNERPAGPATEEQKPAISDSQILAQFWQSRGGTISTPNGSNPQAGPSQVQPHPAVSPEVAAQMQKLIEKKGIRSQIFGSTPPSSGMAETAVQPSQPVQVPNVPAWQGTFSWAFPKPNGQTAIEVQIHVVGMVASVGDVRTDTWPRNLTLKSCKEPVKDSAELKHWLMRHQPQAHLMQFRPSPRAPDGSVNEQKFHAVYKFMAERRIYAYAGWRQPSGKFSYNMFIFPMRNSFAGAVFPGGIPDLPGSGNTLDLQSSVEEAKPQLLNGINIPPALLARMQALEPAKQAQFLQQIVRAQQENMRRQQLQQALQLHNASNLNSLEMSIGPNSYGTMANIPANLPANINGPTNTGAYNTGGGTVNYEMLQSFMQRSAEGSTSQGMNPG